jgi:hypothetical protein
MGTTFCESDLQEEFIRILTGEADMKSVKLVQIAGLLAVTAMLVGGAGAAFAQTVGTAIAQTPPAPSSMKTIGAPSAAAKPEIVPSLFVLNSRGATLQGDTLILTGVTPSSIIFADRPVRLQAINPPPMSSRNGDRATTASPKILRTPPCPSSVRMAW